MNNLPQQSLPQNPNPGQRPPIVLVADGSCDAVSEFGTWAAVAVTPMTRKIFYGTVYPSTISRCELTPILEGLRWIRAECIDLKGTRVRIISDSQFTIQTLAGMYEAKKNLDLWSAVRTASQGLKLDAAWRERNSHPLMELCDSIAHALRESVFRNSEIHPAVKRTATESLNTINYEEILTI